METIFTEFFFAYSLAEYHKQVATIKFYFALAVSHATVQTDRLCSIYSVLPPPLSHITVQYFLSCGETDYTASGHSKSWRENKNFGPDQNTLL
jgi:hypothetical protein